MKKEKLVGILEAIVIIAFGIIIAVFGGGTALDLYFAIVALVAGAVLLIVNIYSLVKVKELNFALTFLSSALITVGVAILAKGLSFGVLIPLMAYLLLGLGIALILYGLFVALRKNLFYGIGQIVVGAVLATLVIIFLTVPEFAQAFWIIVGVVLAIYGVLLLVFTLIDKDGKRK